jgi:hypothetical protein
MPQALCRQCQQLGKSALGVEAHDFDIRAKVVLPPPARAACPTGDAWPDLDQITFSQAAAAPICLHYPSYHLMAWHLGINQIPVALLHHFDVRSADGTGFHF